MSEESPVMMNKMETQDDLDLICGKVKFVYLHVYLSVFRISQPDR